MRFARVVRVIIAQNVTCSDRQGKGFKAIHVELIIVGRKVLCGAPGKRNDG